MQAVRALFARRKSKGGSGKASFSNGASFLQNVGLHLNRQHIAKPASAETGGRSERDIKRGRRIVQQVCLLYLVVLLQINILHSVCYLPTLRADDANVAGGSACLFGVLDAV